MWLTNTELVISLPLVPHRPGWRSSPQLYIRILCTVRHHKVCKGVLWILDRGRYVVHCALCWWLLSWPTAVGSDV